MLFYVDIEVKPDECPLSIGHSSSHFELRRKEASSSSLPVNSQSVCSSPASSQLADSSYDGSTDLEMMNGKLQLHSKLIDALREFTSQSDSVGLFESGVKSRETLLEQALVEQNQVLDVMQEMISTLESENKYSRDTINKQERIISRWEIKSKHDVKELAGLNSKSQDLSLNKDDPQITDLKKQLNEKEQTILSLWSSKHENVSLLAAKLTSIKTKLELERVRCIELEEELYEVKDRVTQLNKEANKKESVMIGKESEIMHLKHEMERLRNFEQVQQHLVMKQRSTLSSKDVHLRSLTRALSKEKKVADQLRRIQSSSRRLSQSPDFVNKIGDKSHEKISEVQCDLHTSLFEQIDGRTACSVELTRITPETELGFSFMKVEHPVPSRVPCLIVKAVKEGSLADGVLRAGDELLEVNRILCQSLEQSRAVHVLVEGVGTLKIVVARTFVYPSLPNKVVHSTPIKLMDCLGNSGESTTWATALHSPNTIFQSFSVETSLIGESQTDDAKFVTVPESFALTFTRDSSDDQMGDISAASKLLHHQEPGEKHCPSTPASVSSVNENESLIVVRSRDEVSVKNRQYDIAELQDQLDESERIRLNFESDLNATCEKLDHFKSESEAIMSENDDLHQQLLSRDSEIDDIQQYILELKTGLVTLQSEVVDDQQKIASLDIQNKMISGELMEVKNTSSQVAVMKGNLEEMVVELKSELEKRENEVRMVLKQTLENTQLTSDVLCQEGELEKLSSKQLSEIKQAAYQANKQFKKIEAEYHITLEELQYFKHEVEQRTLETESMKVELKGAQIKLEAKQEMTTRIQTERDNLRRSNAKLRNEATHLKELVKEAELNLKASNIEEERVGKKLQASMVEKNELFEQLEKSFEESTELSLKLQELAAELKELKEENVSDSRNTNEEWVKSLKFSEARLQRELDSSQKRTEMLTHQSSRIKIETKVFQSQCEATAKELKRARSEKEHITASKDVLSKELAEMQESHSNLHNELNSKQQALDETKSTLMPLQEQVTIDKERRAIHVTKVLELESELEQVQSAKKQAKGMAASLEFIQKQEKFEQAEQFLREKEKNSTVQIDHDSVLLQKSKLEHTALTTSVASMKQQLKENQIVYAEDLEHLKDELALRENELTQIGDELESHRSKNEMIDCKTEHLVESMKELTQKRYSLEKALEGSVKETMKLNNLNLQLQGQVNRLNAELEDTLRSSDRLSSECAGLRQQLQQSDHEVDNLTAQLHAAEVNLEVALITIHKSNRVNTAQSEKLESLKMQCKESHSKMEDFSAQLESGSLELCTRDEELSKLRTTLEMHQQDMSTLQDALVAMQNGADNARKRIQELDAEHRTLLSTISELCIEKKMAQDIFEEEISIEKAQKKIETEQYRADIETLRHKEKEHIYEVDRLKADNQVLAKSLNEFISVQEEMKKSIGKSGNEKDIEIMKLQDKVRILNQKCDDTEEKHNSVIEREQKLKEQVLEMGHNISDLEELVKKEKACSEDLKSEIEVHQVTAQGIEELTEKVTLLNEGLMERTKQLFGLQEIHNSTVSELSEMQIENESLLENVSRLATLKLSVVDQAEAMKDLKKKLAEKEVAFEQILRERDHMVKELEGKKTQAHIQELKHASKNIQELETNVGTSKKSKQLTPMSAIVTGSTGNEIKSKEELLQIIQQKEDEVLRTKEYTEQLLISIMINSPFLLEK